MVNKNNKCHLVLFMKMRIRLITFLKTGTKIFNFELHEKKLLSI